jgi:hypothetical protein
MDAIYVGISLLFFGLTLGVVRLCSAMGGPR